MTKAFDLFEKIKISATELQVKPDLITDINKQVVGLCLQESASLLVLQEDGFQPRYLRGEYFDIFVVMNEMLDAKIEIDPLSVSMLYEDKHGVNILPKLTNLVSQVYLSVSNLKLCGQKLKELYQVTKASALLIEYSEKVKQGGIVEVDALMQELTEVTSVNAMFDHSILQACEGFTDHLERLQNLKPGEIIGVESGFEQINQNEGGYHDGDLIIVGARPGVGKTAFALHGLMSAGMKNIASGIFSTEMRKEQLAARMVCNAGSLQYTKTRNGQLSDEDWGRVSLGVSSIYDLPMRIVDKPTLYIDEIKSYARYWVMHYGVKIIFLDYLQNLSQRNNSKNRSELVGADAKALKALALELGIPIVVLAQLNRDATGRPEVSDLKESGDIEQAADLIYLLYRDEIVNENSTMKGIMEIIVGKARFGPLTSYFSRFHGEYQSFSSLSNTELGTLMF